MLFSVERQFAFYQSYHKHRKNRLIHILAIPLLVLTFLILISYFPLPLSFGSLNPAAVLTVLYCSYVIFLDVPVGLVFFPYGFALYFVAASVRARYDYAAAAPVAFVLHAVAWAAQLVGHYKFEARAPALLTSLVHAVAAAPFVVCLETVFSLGLMEGTRKRLRNAGVVRKVRGAQRRSATNSAS